MTGESNRALGVHTVYVRCFTMADRWRWLVKSSRRLLLQFRQDNKNWGTKLRRMSIDIFRGGKSAMLAVFKLQLIIEIGGKHSTLYSHPLYQTNCLIIFRKFAVHICPFCILSVVALTVAMFITKTSNCSITLVYRRTSSKFEYLIHSSLA